MYLFGGVMTPPYEKRLIMLRIAVIEDVPEMLAIYAPYVENTTVSFEYAPPTLEEFTRRFTAYTRQFPWLVWEEDGKILGYAYASAPFTREAFGWCAEPTIYLRPEACGKKIAAKLYAVLEEILWRQGYQVLYALVCGENKPSRRFHEKQGYAKCAEFPSIGFKMGRWLSLIWYEKRQKMANFPSISPRPWSEVVQNAKTFRDILGKLSIP